MPVWSSLGIANPYADLSPHIPYLMQHSGITRTVSCVANAALRTVSDAIRATETTRKNLAKRNYPPRDQSRKHVNTPLGSKEMPTILFQRWSSG